MTSESLNQIRKTVREFILSEFLPTEDPSALSETTPLISGGIMDSISVIRLVSHLEGRFNIKLEQRDITLKRFDSVDRIVETIHEKLKSPSTTLEREP